MRQLLLRAGNLGHQPAKKEAGLKALDKVEQRIGQTVAVEFPERIEGIHVAKIEQPQLLLMVHQQISTTEIPLHQPLFLTGFQGRK